MLSARYLGHPLRLVDTTTTSLTTDHRHDDTLPSGRAPPKAHDDSDEYDRARDPRAAPGGAARNRLNRHGSGPRS